VPLGFLPSWWIWKDPTWAQAEIWAVAILLLPSAICVVANQLAAQKWFFFTRLITGSDGHWSTSKAGYLVWTYAFAFAALATLIKNANVDKFYGTINTEYLVVLGIPAAAGFGAKVIANRSDPDGVSNVGNTDGRAPAETNVGSGVGQLVTDDDGDTALHKFQYLTFNLLLIGFFLVKFIGNELDGLPDLPDTFVGLTGVSAAAYLAQKGLSMTGKGAQITNVVPREARPGEEVKILGTGLATPEWKNVQVLVGKQAAFDVSAVIDVNITTVYAKIPQNAIPGATAIVVVAYDGSSSNSLPFDVIA